MSRVDPSGPKLIRLSQEVTKAAREADHPEESGSRWTGS